MLDNLCGIWDNEDNEERLLERDTPVRSCDTASALWGFSMFDEYGNYIPNDEEAVEFEEFDMEEE